MHRVYYDQIAAEWQTALNAIRAAGGDAITLPVNHMAMILLGYEQHRQERAAALAWIDAEQQSGQLDRAAAAHARHALGDLSDDELAAQIREAAKEAP